MPVETITFWHWWVLAGGLLLVERFGLGAFFLWFSASAALVGLALLGWTTMPMNLQFGLFGSLSIACVLAWRQVCAGRRMDPSHSDGAVELQADGAIELQGEQT
jgi:membrane protein implicated in regulation of membrane protease activity